MDKPARVKLSGSGSAIPKAPPHAGPLGFYSGLIAGQIDSMTKAIELGVVCYTRQWGTDPDRMIIAHDRETPNGIELSAYCEKKGISEGGRGEIEAAVLEADPTGDEFVYCAPTIAGATILHRKAPPYGLKMIAQNRFCLHVSKQWLKAIYAVPPHVSASMFFAAGKIFSTNHAERFLTRPHGNGSDHSGNVVASVEKAPNTWASPWPEDMLGFAPMVAVDTYTGVGPEQRIPFNAWLGPCEGTVIDFYGDGEKTATANGFTDGRPSAEADNIDPQDPASWYNGFFGASTLLPPPTNATGDYRPGVYYGSDGSVAVVNLGSTNGHTTNATSNNYPVYQSDYPISIERPPLEPGNTIQYEATRNGQTVLADLVYQSADNAPNPVVFFEEKAQWSDTQEFLRLEISVFTGNPNPCPKSSLVAEATFYNDGASFDLIPDGDAPVPTVIMEDRWTRVVVPLDGQLEEAGSDYWAAGQQKTFSYKVSHVSTPGLKVYPNAVFAWGESLITPTGRFERFEPFPLM